MLLFAFVAFALPLLANLHFGRFDGGMANPFHRDVGFGNYRELLGDTGAREALGRGLAYAFVSSSAQIALALVAAAALVDRPRLAAWFRRGALIPVLVPPVVYVTVFRLAFDATSGPMAAILHGLTGRSVVLLDEENLLSTGILLTTLQFFPLSFLLLLDRLRSIPAAIERQAAIDGFGPWQYFVVVQLPATASLIGGLWALRFFLTFGKFDVLYFLAGSSGLYRAVDTPPLFIFRESLAQGRLGYGAAACGVLLAAGIAALALAIGVRRLLRGRDTRRIWQLLTPKRRPGARVVRAQLVLGACCGTSVLGLFALVIAGPVLLMAWGSLSDGFPLRPGAFTLGHFSRLFGEFSFVGPLITSAGITLTVVAACLAVAVPGAFFAETYHVPRMRAAGLLSLAGYCVPSILLVYGVAMLGGAMGWGGSPFAVIVGLSGFCLPLVWVTLMTFGSDLPAPGAVRASSDRLPPWRYFWRVYLPNRRGALASAAVLTFAACWSDFLFASVLGGSAARTAVVVFQEIFNGSVIPWGVLMASAVVISVPTVAAGFLIDRAFVDRHVPHEY